MVTAAGVAARTKRMRATAGTSVDRKKLGISAEKESSLRQRLLSRTCSAPWVDTHFRDVTDRTPDGETITYRLLDGRPYPPGGAGSLMCRCAACLAQRHPEDHPDQIAPLTPPDIAGNAVCVDHQTNRMNRAYGASPSAVSIQRAQELNVRLETVKLLPESDSALRREIRRIGKFRMR